MPALAMQMSSPAERGGDVLGERGYVLVARGVADAGEDVQGGVDAVRSGAEGGQVRDRARADGEAAGAGGGEGDGDVVAEALAGAGDVGDEGGTEMVFEGGWRRRR